MVAPEDLAKGNGIGRALLRCGESTDWQALLYAPGSAIPPGRFAWLAFIRANPVEELEKAWRAAAEVTDAEHA